MTNVGAVGTCRTSGEVAGQRALAEIASGQTAYRRTVADAVTRTLDWVTGETGRAPASGDAVPADPDAIRREMLLAVELERRAQPVDRDAATWLGKVGHTLSWWRCEPLVEPPLL